MEARNRTLPDWLTRIRTRQIKLPRFQRFEAWTHSTITGLLNTVLQELPAGAVLVLEIGDEEPFVSRTVVGAPTEGERVTEHLLDGQQRLTALWRVLHDNYPDRSYFVSLQTDEDSGAPYSIKSWQRWEKNGNRYPEWLNRPAQVWQQNLIPVHMLRPGDDAAADFKAWAKLAADVDTDQLLEIIEQGNRLRQKFQAFNIPFLSLPSSTPKETALNVFIQMNTSATQLSTYDIVVAQVEAGTEKSLHELVSDLKADVPYLEELIDPSDLTLSVSALLQDKAPIKTTFLSKGFSNGLIDNWDIARRGIRRAVQFLEDEKISDSKRLPTDVVVAPLAALWGLAPDGLDAEGQARTLLRKYLWRACFTERYERTSATRALVDFRDMKSIMEGRSANATIFNETDYPLPSRDQIVGAGWPVKKDRLPRVVLALSLRAGGYDLADGSLVTRDNLKKREYHHLFPVARLKAENKDDRDIFRALNCALVTWKTNRNISDKTPEKYLAERLEGSSLGEEEVRSRLASHLVPYDEMKTGNYDTFLLHRADAMFDLYAKTLHRRDGLNIIINADAHAALNHAAK